MASRIESNAFFEPGLHLDPDDLAVPLAEVDPVEAKRLLASENPALYSWLLAGLNGVEARSLQEKVRVMRVAAAVHYVIFKRIEADDISATSLSDADIKAYVSGEGDGS